MEVLTEPDPPDAGNPADSLRQAWLQAIASTAPHLGGLQDLLSRRFDDAERHRRTGEAELMRIVESALQEARSSCAPSVAVNLERRLRQTIYEYLLAVDASLMERPRISLSVEPPGAVAEMPRAPEPVAAEPRAPEPPAQLPRAAEPPATGAPSWQVRSPGPQPEASARAPATPAPATSTPATSVPAPSAPASSPAAGAAPTTPSASPRVTPAPAAPPWPTDPAPPSTAEPPAATGPGDPPAQPAPPATGWRVRERTPAGNVQREGPRVSLPDVRRKLTEWIGRRRYAEAAAVVQQVCQEVGGEPASELAIETGDLCRARDKRMAAISCYVAAVRANPVSELALNRLAELCIDDGQVDLGVSHLERIAQLARLRGDERAALRVYRRIVSIAPERDDVLALLMQAHLAGHLDD